MQFDVSKGCSHSKYLYLEHKPDGHVVQLKIGCKARFDAFCPQCAAQWRKSVRARYQQGIFNMRSPKMLTLTLRKFEGMEISIKRIWSMRKSLFKILRNKGYKIRSWCGVVEMPNHIHLIIDSDFIPQNEISLYWNEITHTSFRVDIRPVWRPKYAVQYITKYLTKMTGWDGLNLTLFKGFHIIGSDNLHLDAYESTFLCPFCGCGGNWHVTSQEHYYAVLFFNEKPPDLSLAS